MFFTFIKSTFGWLPTPLFALVGAVFVFFLMIILFKAIKVIIQLLQFLKDIFGGLIAKVVDFFV